MIEAANKQLKYRFLYHKHIADFNELKKFVEEAVADYNNRPHHVLNGFTSLEVLNGLCPDKKTYKDEMVLAKTSRLIENKKIKCFCFSF